MKGDTNEVKLIELNLDNGSTKERSNLEIKNGDEALLVPIFIKEFEEEQSLETVPYEEFIKSRLVSFIFINHETLSFRVAEMNDL